MLARDVALTPRQSRVVRTVARPVAQLKLSRRRRPRQAPASTVQGPVMSPAPAPQVAASTPATAPAGVFSLPAADLAPQHLINNLEVVWGTGRTAEQVVAGLNALASRQRTAVCLRVEELVAAEVLRMLPDAQYVPSARVITLQGTTALPKAPRLPGTVAIVTSPSADPAVAEECRVVASLLGCYAFKVTDINVPTVASSSLSSGLSLDMGASTGALAAADVVVVASGLDVALASLLAGMVDAPVVALPTRSRAAADADQDKAQLLSSLNASGPSGVTLVNVDSGFAAAATAARMLRMASRMHAKRTAAAQSRMTMATAAA